MDVAHHPGAVPGDATVDALASGLAHEDAGDLDRAGAVYRDALRTAPDNPALLRSLARVLARQGRLRIAAAKLRRATEVAPDDLLAQRDLIDVLRYLDDTDAALAVVDGVLARHPDLPGALTKRGMVLLSRGDVDTALAAFDRAVALTPPAAPDMPGANAEAVGTAVLNRGLARLAAGDLAGGWDDYEAGFAAEVRSLRRPDRPRWDGATLPAGTTLLLWREQGVGDDVLFLSCLADALAAAGPLGTVRVEVDARLVPLVRRSFPADASLDIVAARPDGTLEPHDVQCPLGSLPRLFRRELHRFTPATSTNPGFFTPDPERVEQWRGRLGPGPHVGITWRSGLVTAERRLDFSRIDDWHPILGAPGVHIVDVQYDGGRDELAPVAARLGVTVTEPAELDANGIDLRNDLDDLAALCVALDLVIGCANATTALAAAVGTAVWEPAPVTDPWRLGTDRSPFLPAKRIFARRPGEGWADVLMRIGGDLAAQPW